MGAGGPLAGGDPRRGRPAHGRDDLATAPGGGGLRAFWTMLAGGLIALVGIAAIGLPTVFAGGNQLFSPNQGPLTSAEEMGNLIRPLAFAQYPGPWPVGDFRVEPLSTWPACSRRCPCIATVVAAGFGLAAAVSRRAWGLPCSPWHRPCFLVWLGWPPLVQGKALGHRIGFPDPRNGRHGGIPAWCRPKAEVEGEVEGRGLSPRFLRSG